jgi:adenylate kinase family enzyme
MTGLGGTVAPYSLILLPVEQVQRCAVAFTPRPTQNIAMTLADLGPRICVIGPSSSGKSTLAAAIGRTRGLPVVHLDQLYHKPETDWEPRPSADFDTLHAAAIESERWVMDGGYSRVLPLRLARATGVIRIECSTTTSLIRYLRRSWFERERHGGLSGGHDSAKWLMIRHIAVTTRINHARDAAQFERLTLPKIRLASTRDLALFYRAEGLSVAKGHPE